MRVNKKWNQKDRPRSAEQMANAVAAAIWKLAAQVLLKLENENFETSDQAQRLDIVGELIIYLVHMTDRRIIEQASEQERGLLISALVKDLARMLDDSRNDLGQHEDHRGHFIDRCNQRVTEYAKYKHTEQEGASFAMRCLLGEYIRKAMGERDSKWIPDYIIGREAPEIEATLKLTLSGLVTF
jgi:hypothetical protein